MIAKPRVVILGAGPAGLGAAFQLTRRELASVTVLEQNNQVGGNAGSFEFGGMHVDYGSHRLHPSCDPEILRDIQELLGYDLLDRPRHGRIRLRGRWIHFPLKPLDLIFRLPPNFIAGVVTNLIGKMMRRKVCSSNIETFASILEAGLGSTICRDFYFPYARKIWGLEPEALSAMQARRRVSANSVSKIAKKILMAVPGFKPQGSGRFFYPRHGYGQISTAFYRAARENGAKIHLNARVRSVEMKRDDFSIIHYEQGGKELSLHANLVWSTIPITALARCLKPSPPKECLHAVDNIHYRAMILVYLVLEKDRFSEYDAHYFPEPDIPITRISEPKNYSHVREPQNRTVLCAELPCSTDDPEWHMTDEELGERVCDSLKSAEIPVRTPVKEVMTRRLRQAYPIYKKDYEVYFDRIDRWFNQVKNLLTFGRQGLFAHDNTHHALYMAYSAVDCLGKNGTFNGKRWEEYRREFESHVVED